eukprot:10157397-Alexandrium_andersonii.AAC.1
MLGPRPRRIGSPLRRPSGWSQRWRVGSPARGPPPLGARLRVPTPTAHGPRRPRVGRGTQIPE